MLSKDGNSFHLKKGRFTEFIDGRLPMDRERKYYSKEKDSDPTIRLSASKDNLNSSIYLRAHSISEARSKSQISSYAPPPLAEVKQANASFQPDPNAKGLLTNIESTFTFTKVLEPIRTSEGNFNDYD